MDKRKKSKIPTRSGTSGAKATRSSLKKQSNVKKQEVTKVETKVVEPEPAVRTPSSKIPRLKSSSVDSGFSSTIESPYSPADDVTSPPWDTPAQQSVNFGSDSGSNAAHTQTQDLVIVDEVVVDDDEPKEEELVPTDTYEIVISEGADDKPEGLFVVSDDDVVTEVDSRQSNQNKGKMLEKIYENEVEVKYDKVIEEDDEMANIKEVNKRLVEALSAAEREELEVLTETHPQQLTEHHVQIVTKQVYTRSFAVVDNSEFTQENQAFFQAQMEQFGDSEVEFKPNFEIGQVQILEEHFCNQKVDSNMTERYLDEEHVELGSEPELNLKQSQVSIVVTNVEDDKQNSDESDNDAKKPELQPIHQARSSSDCEIEEISELESNFKQPEVLTVSEVKEIDSENELNKAPIEEHSKIELDEKEPRSNLVEHELSYEELNSDKSSDSEIYETKVPPAPHMMTEQGQEINEPEVRNFGESETDEGKATSEEELLSDSDELQCSLKEVQPVTNINISEPNLEVPEVQLKTELREADVLSHEVQHETYSEIEPITRDYQVENVLEEFIDKVPDVNNVEMAEAELEVKGELESSSNESDIDSLPGDLIESKVVNEESEIAQDKLEPRTINSEVVENAAETFISNLESNMELKVEISDSSDSRTVYIEAEHGFDNDIKHANTEHVENINEVLEPELEVGLEDDARATNSKTPDDATEPNFDLEIRTKSAQSVEILEESALESELTLISEIKLQHDDSDDSNNSGTDSDVENTENHNKTLLESEREPTSKFKVERVYESDHLDSRTPDIVELEPNFDIGTEKGNTNFVENVPESSLKVELDSNSELSAEFEYESGNTDSRTTYHEEPEPNFDLGATQENAIVVENIPESSLKLELEPNSEVSAEVEYENDNIDSRTTYHEEPKPNFDIGTAKENAIFVENIPESSLKLELETNSELSADVEYENDNIDSRTTYHEEPEPNFDLGTAKESTKFVENVSESPSDVEQGPNSEMQYESSDSESDSNEPKTNSAEPELKYDLERNALNISSSESSLKFASTVQSGVSVEPVYNSSAPTVFDTIEAKNEIVEPEIEYNSEEEEEEEEEEELSLSSVVTAIEVIKPTAAIRTAADDTKSDVIKRQSSVEVARAAAAF
ncbi:hypothetical protein CHUAL_005863 [Chamberlinius hualienensis]